MQDTANITCPNPLCQALNPEAHRFCQQCRTPLPKRYLWAIGQGVNAYKPGKLLADRYLLKRDRILLDTKPGFVPSFPPDIPDGILPYLRLFPYQLHVPQVYGFVTLGKKGKGEDVWLLEQAPIYTRDRKKGREEEGHLMPALTRVWQDATDLRQLHWLWQMAQLWQPLSSEGVASTLLNPELLRVEGPSVRLLELQLDRSLQTLTQLGYFWQEWISGAAPAVAAFLEPLCDDLIQGALSSDQLLVELDRALVECGRSRSRSYQIITRTDTGPSRQRNEDACYPSSGTLHRADSQAQTSPLVLVCDGIGGHEGGNVASNLAIETVQQHLPDLAMQDDSWDPASLATELELAVCAANDRISRRNDAELRYERQRMGTTLVMALAHGQDIYITHVGDSRAYWITRSGCHQVTLDDDVACREVRLGYALYREALQQIGAGSLVQALGMNASSNLHPTVQRLIVDEDCIFLLCSDGLSDGDRVEQYWDTEILPVLEGKVDLATAAARLIEIANIQNGHDNVTVGLIYCQVSGNAQRHNPSGTAQEQLTSSSSAAPSPSLLKTQLLPPQKRSSSVLGLLLGILMLLGLGGLLAYLWIPEVGTWVDAMVLKAKQYAQRQSPSPSETTSVPIPAAISALSPGSLLQTQTQAIALSSQPRTAPTSSTPVPSQGIVPVGSLLQVLSKQATPGQAVWVRLKVCSIPTANAAAKPEAIVAERAGPPQPVVQKPPTAANPTLKPKSDRSLLQPGDTGWIRETEVTALTPVASANANGTTSSNAPSQLGKCTAGAGYANPNPTQ